VLLRIEDLDRARVRPGSVERCLADLEWLGLDWDGEALLQSGDTRAMEAACADLERRGLAYPCVCTRSEISALSAPHGGDDEARYPGTCRGRFESRQHAERASGRSAGVRARIPPGELEIRDGFAAARSFDVARESGDLLIRRRDGGFAYQLAVAVDDARTGVTEIVRGDDLLPSAARQWHLQEMLGLPHPSWFHVPLVVDEAGERLAKRRESLSLAALREQHVDPRAVVAWVANVSGSAAPQRTGAAELLASFDLARVPHSPVVLRPENVEALLHARR
jgi:glutamyl-tRNA synthetase